MQSNVVATHVPKMSFSVTVGSNTPLPTPSANGNAVALTLATSQSNPTPWIFRGNISIVSSTTAIGSDNEQAGEITAVASGATAGTVSIVTGSAQTFSLNETGTMVSGQTMNLQQLVVRVIQ